MPRTSVHNDTKDMLGLWLEPWGSDYWMRPGECFTVVADESAEPVDEAFETVIHDQGISVWVTAANSAEVIDADGNEICSGHQRPIEVFRSWTESARQAAERVERSADSSPSLRETARKHFENMQRGLEAAEARETELNDADSVTSVPTTENTIATAGNPR